MSLLNTLIPSRIQAPARTNGTGSELQHTVKPVYHVKETTDAWGLTVYLPGVAKDGLELTAEDGQIRIVGRRQWQRPASWTLLHRETGAAPFELVLAHDNTVNIDQIAAELRDGVLRVSLPKHEAVKPRKIAIK